MPTRIRHSSILLVSIPITEESTICYLLKKFELNLYQASSLTECTSITCRHKIHLIIIDLDSDTTNISQTISYFRTRPQTAQIPLLILTTPLNKTTIPPCLNYEDIDFILKPYSIQELSIRIQRQLQLYRSQHILRKQNIKLQETLEARDKLYAIIAHDLRAPIGTIKMLNSTLSTQKHKIKNNYILTLLKMIDETTEDAFNLLENLLGWTRTQNGKTKIYAKPFPINSIIHQTISLFQTLASNKEIGIIEHTTPQTVVYADEEMIKTVLRNLISNAIKFTYPGGKIDISITDLPQHILISVKDNGKGISSTEQKKLLKNNTYTTTYGTHNEKGSGLGLSLSKEFIKLNKGKLWFSSQEGIGTTFFFTLPHA